MPLQVVLDLRLALKLAKTHLKLRTTPASNICATVWGFLGLTLLFPPPKGADNGGMSSSNSSGIQSSLPAGNSKSSSRNLGSSTGEKEEGKKVRRQWESWSTEDKNTFFEGLYEVGALKSREPPLPVPKIHEQSLKANFKMHQIFCCREKWADCTGSP